MNKKELSFKITQLLSWFAAYSSRASLELRNNLPHYGDVREYADLNTLLAVGQVSDAVEDSFFWADWYDDSATQENTDFDGLGDD